MAVRLSKRCNGIRKPERFDDIWLACACDARGRLGASLVAVQSVATATIAASADAARVTGQKAGEMVHAARVKAVAAWLASTATPGA